MDRKYKQEDFEIQLLAKKPQFVIFDVIAFNDQQTSQVSLKERKQILSQNFATEGNVTTSELQVLRNDSEMEEKVAKMMEKAILMKCEGLVIKSYNDKSFYDSTGKRSS